MNLREVRIKTGLTQQELSDFLNIPVRSIENWESGKRKCPAYVEQLIIDKIRSTYHEKDWKEAYSDISSMLESDLRIKGGKYDMSNIPARTYVELLLKDMKEELNKEKKIDF